MRDTADCNPQFSDGIRKPVETRYICLKAVSVYRSAKKAINESEMAAVIDTPAITMIVTEPSPKDFAQSVKAFVVNTLDIISDRIAETSSSSD